MFLNEESSIQLLLDTEYFRGYMGRIRRATGRRIDSLAKWLLKFRIIAIPAKAIASSSMAWSFVSRTDRIRTNRLKDRIKQGIIPEHVSIIMDGNRKLQELHIDDEIYSSTSKEDFTKELIDAFNTAIENANHVNENELKNTAFNMIPGMDK